MWLERTQQAELVDLEVGEENNLEEGEEVESNMEIENMLNNEVDIEQKDLDKNASNKMLAKKGLKNQQNRKQISEKSTLERQCAIAKVKVLLNEAKEEMEVAARRGNFAEARNAQEQVRFWILGQYDSCLTHGVQNR